MKMLSLPATEHFLVEFDDSIIELLDKDTYVVELCFQVTNAFVDCGFSVFVKGVDRR